MENTKHKHYLDTYKNLSKTHQCAFMRELFKSAYRRVSAGNDGDKVETWVKKIEKLYFKLDL